MYVSKYSMWREILKIFKNSEIRPHALPETLLFISSDIRPAETLMKSQQSQSLSTFPSHWPPAPASHRSASTVVFCQSAVEAPRPSKGMGTRSVFVPVFFSRRSRTCCVQRRLFYDGYKVQQ